MKVEYQTQEQRQEGPPIVGAVRNAKSLIPQRLSDIIVWWKRPSSVLFGTPRLVDEVPIHHRPGRAGSHQLPADQSNNQSISQNS